MKLIATMLLRNEAWVVGLSARVALMWVDHLVCLVHASTDATEQIIEGVAAEHPGRVTILREPDPLWREMEHRQRMLNAARLLGATHVAVVDADEVLTGDSLAGVRGQIESLRSRVCLQATMFCMWRSLDQYRIDGKVWAGRKDLVLAFCDSPGLLWRPVLGYDHHRRHPLNSLTGLVHYGAAMHLQWSSWRRLIAKHVWYQMHERLRYPEKPVAQIAKTYALAPDEKGLKVAEAPAEWWAPYSHLRHLVDLNAEPWHEAECQRLLEIHGRQKFAGLNLYGADRQCLTGPAPAHLRPF
jgi:hypothetical protein